MRRLVLGAISTYQRYVSPYKGFCCAYRINTGRKSCSALGFRAVRRYGVIAGLAVLRRRTYLCGVAHRRFSPVHGRPHHRQRGDCDPGCDLPGDFNCNTPGSKSCSSIFDFASCCECGSCDGSDRKRKGNEQEQYVYLPPNTASKRTGGK